VGSNDRPACFDGGNAFSTFVFHSPLILCADFLTTKCRKWTQVLAAIFGSKDFCSTGAGGGDYKLVHK
jgi:hypothetical protein